MNWKKILVKKTIISRIPFVDNLRKLKRNLFGYLPERENIELTINSYTRIRSALEELAARIEGATILEVGSGWFPIIPILLARDGAKKIFMSDLNIHMDSITFAETVVFLKNYFPNDAYMQAITNFSSLPIEYLAPFSTSDVSDKSLDIIMSNNVLEHIPRSNIYNLFSSLRPKVSNCGAMVHLVDHSDHFEHFDKSISRIEFLTWNEEKHALINYLIQDGENRMRHQEYYEIFRDSGFEIINEECDVDEKTLEAVKTLDLVYPYSKMLPEQLAVLTSIYSLKPT